LNIEDDTNILKLVKGSLKKYLFAEDLMGPNDFLSAKTRLSMKQAHTLLIQECMGHF